MAKKVAKKAAKKVEGDFPRTVVFGAARVRVSQRANGFFALQWRENGERRRTTKSGSEKALKWAAEKARALDAGTGQRWVSAGDAETLVSLRGIAGDGAGAVNALLGDVAGAQKWLEGRVSLETAARWYAQQGPLRLERVTLRAAAARFLAEYDGAGKSRETRRTFGQEIEGFLLADFLRAELAVCEVTEGDLLAWVSRKVRGREGPAARTLANRMTTWVTFLNRCRDWRFLPEGRHAGDALRKPTIPDAGREIFTIDQGRRLLAAVREDDPKLEGYLLVAGWLGLRPSEIQRLRWGAFEWERGYLHVSAGVARKTASERYVPVEGRLLARLRVIFLAAGGDARGLVARFRSREFLSVLARRRGVCDRWPNDVLRHSFCSYRIAVTRSLAQVAEEAGNSPDILKSNYRRPLMHEDGLAWWDLLGEPVV